MSGFLFIKLFHLWVFFSLHQKPCWAQGEMDRSIKTVNKESPEDCERSLMLFAGNEMVDTVYCCCLANTLK